jgi:putative addiction module component (TIGR02574 family)
MSITLDAIVEEARQLPADVVAELVDRMLVARPGGMTAGVADIWRKESRRRMAEIESGRVRGVPGEEVSARLRQMLGS